MVSSPVGMGAVRGVVSAARARAAVSNLETKNKLREAKKAWALPAPAILLAAAAGRQYNRDGVRRPDDYGECRVKAARASTVRTV